jgi:transposase-like protein
VARRTVAKAAVRKRARQGVGRRYTDAERQRILTAARRENLTGAQVQDRFGVTQVTYYLWKKRARPAIRDAARTVRESGVLDLAEEVRRQIRDRIRGMIPDTVRSEISSVISDITGGAGRRGRPRRGR